MSREALPGRAALSFAAADGILDIDQILSTSPWNQIDDYVQRNFMQNVLNDFNDRMALDPRRVPTDSKTEETHQEKSPRRNTAKNRNTAEMASNDPSPVDDGNGNITSTKETDASTNDKTPRDEGRGSDAKERAGRAAKESKGEEEKNAKLLKKRGKLENPSKPSPKGKETVANGARARAYRRRTGSKIAKADIVDNETRTVMHGTETAIEEPNTPGHTNTVSPIKTSTPKREYVKSLISNSTGKGETIERKRKSMYSRYQESSTSKAAALANRSINNLPGFRGTGHGKYETPLRVKRPKKPISHVGERKHPERYQKSVKKEKRSNPNKRAKKTAGKLEEGLRGGEGKRRNRKIQQQRKAERTFEKLGLQVNRIVKRMGYVPVKGRSSNRNTRNSNTTPDTSNESSSNPLHLSYSSCSSSSSSSSCSSFCTCSSSSSSDEARRKDLYTEYPLGCCCGRGCIPSSSTEDSGSSISSTSSTE